MLIAILLTIFLMMASRKFGMFKRLFLLSIALFLVFDLGQSAQSNDDSKRVALIIVGEDEQPKTACISLPPDDDTSGYDVLLASGLSINASVGPLGTGVCALDEVGCFYPSQTCFCQCSGGRCSYWAYYYQDAGESEWRYSQISVDKHKVEDGGLELWIWRKYASADEDAVLPDYTWDAICAVENPTQQFDNVDMAKTEQESSIFKTIGYGVFAVLLLGIIGGLWWRRQHMH